MCRFKCRDQCFTPLFAAAVLFGSASASLAQSINVDFGFFHPLVPAPYSGTAVAPDAGTFWNEVGRFEFFWPNMAYSDGTVTGDPEDPENFPGIGVEVFGWTPPGGVEVAVWPDLPILHPALFADYLYAFNAAEEINCCIGTPIPLEDLETLYPMTISGLDPAKEYDLYLYSKNSGISPGEGAGPSSTQFFVNRRSRKVINSDDLPEFVHGDNWTGYSRVSPDSEGNLVVEYLDIRGVGAAFNGFQLLEHVAGPLEADTDFDGDVDGLDFLDIQIFDPSLIPTWQTQFSTTPALSAVNTAVPEPATALLLAFGAIGISSLSRKSVSSKNF